MADRLFWSCWLVATLLVGLVAGLMLGHTLILARFLDWMLVAGPAGVLARTYPVFRASLGRGGLAAFHTVAGLEVLAVLGFGAAAIVRRRHRVAGVFVAVVGTAWALDALRLGVRWAGGGGAAGDRRGPSAGRDGLRDVESAHPRMPRRIPDRRLRRAADPAARRPPAAPVDRAPGRAGRQARGRRAGALSP